MRIPTALVLGLAVWRLERAFRGPDPLDLVGRQMREVRERLYAQAERIDALEHAATRAQSHARPRTDAPEGDDTAQATTTPHRPSQTLGTMIGRDAKGRFTGNPQ